MVVETEAGEAHVSALLRLRRAVPLCASFLVLRDLEGERLGTDSDSDSDTSSTPSPASREGRGGREEPGQRGQEAGSGDEDDE